MSIIMQYYDINDPYYLEDIRKGETSSLDIICPKFPKVPSQSHGLLTDHDANNLGTAIESKNKITALDLKFNQLETGALATILKSLSKCPHFQSLRLEILSPNDKKNIVSDADVASLSELISGSTSLTELNLSSLKLTAPQQVKIIEACVESQSLEKLRLFNCGISSVDPVCKIIRKNSQLKSLACGPIPFTVNALEDLVEALNGNNCLTVLELHRRDSFGSLLSQSAAFNMSETDTTTQDLLKRIEQKLDTNKQNADIKTEAQPLKRL
jgi:hypothetical protein